MSEVRPTAQPMTFKDRFSQAASDSRVTAKESRELKAHISAMDLPDSDKEALTQMVDQLNDATENSFFFGLFKWKSGINSEEMAGLQSLAKENRMANQLLRFYSEATTQQSTLDQNLIQGRNIAQGSAAPNYPAQNSNYEGTTTASHRMDPNGVNFNPSTRSVDNTPMGDMEIELFEAIMNYPGNKATEAEAREIARTLNEAASALGYSAENTRKMLAVFAHESGGFDPDARSHTGAGGLGQLTGIAIEDMDRLSSGNGPYAQFRDNMVRPGGDRTDIRTNVWTSVAYMHNLMGQIGSQDVSNAFVAYNTGVGGYRALMTMGEGADAYLAQATGVANKGAEARAYAGHVENAYNRMFA